MRHIDVVLGKHAFERMDERLGAIEGYDDALNKLNSHCKDGNLIPERGKERHFHVYYPRLGGSFVIGPDEEDYENESRFFAITYRSEIPWDNKFNSRRPKTYEARIEWVPLEDGELVDKLGRTD